jgi:hypothetical protein
MCQDEVVADNHLKEPSMGGISTIGLDIAKSAFQVHGVDAEGTIKLRRRLRRSEAVKFFGGLGPCRVGLEACGSAPVTSANLRSDHKIVGKPAGIACLPVEPNHFAETLHAERMRRA